MRQHFPQAENETLAGVGTGVSIYYTQTKSNEKKCTVFTLSPTPAS
jgi:hypothetical protein